MTLPLTRRTAGRLFVALFVLAVPACGGSDVPMQKTVKVTGRVMLDGKPAAGVDVRLIPVDKTNFKLNETPLGTADADGRVVFTTYYTGDGAPAGEYQVVIAYPDQVPEEPEGDETAGAIAAAKAKKGGAGKRFPAVYQNPQKSGLKVTVSQPGELPPFELSSKAK
jgi:hypothetical protein